ncbi:MarR family transcriptional regulator [Gordonia amicalis]|nr:MarR family transcriptional regulator [Gordonia amicalis]UOG22925.1 MarR family transcriptional regulator [Gordonia amicalis]
MDHPRLTPTQSSVLFILLAESRELSTSEIRGFGPALDKGGRERLNSLGLVESRLGARRAYFHVLTDKGWAWCAAELRNEPPARANSFLRAMYTVLDGIGRYLNAEDLRLHEVFGRPRVPSADPDSTGGDPPSVGSPTPVHGPDSDPRAQIAAAYRSRVPAPGGFVLVTDLRTDLPVLSPDVFDATMVAFQREPGVSLIPQEDQALLTPADRAAAVTVGTQPCHLFAIEEI